MQNIISVIDFNILNDYIKNIENIHGEGNKKDQFILLKKIEIYAHARQKVRGKYIYEKNYGF